MVKSSSVLKSACPAKTPRPQNMPQLACQPGTPCKAGLQVLCASNDAHDQVEPIIPPQDVPVGEKITFEG